MNPIINEKFSLTSEQIQQIDAAFAKRKKLASARERALFGIFDATLTEEEALALRFLYAYMPIQDLADYDGELFLTHIRHALNTRQHMPWGAEISDELFLYYVLPPRINNEQIEDYRGVIADELNSRVQGLSMSEAILETNYWCYEKATYTGSDARTISPLGMIRSAKGRCGEESTLTTAALRSIGIPARQCYTPRWAHVDDNHAWVEAWADGKWHFLGACEPEARLNQGWFDAPAARAMLVHTSVPAGYQGSEPFTEISEVHKQLNLLDHYAPVCELSIYVEDADGRPAAFTDIQFQLYNYAELFTIASMKTDDQGRATFVTGFGDLIIRAMKQDQWGEVLFGGSINHEQNPKLQLKLSRSEQAEGIVDFELTPPSELPTPEDPSPLSSGAFEKHRQRLQQCEQIRAAYEDTFVNEEAAKIWAQKLELDAERLFKVLSDARGNYTELTGFLEQTVPEHGEFPLRLLESLTSKDLIDVRQKTLQDHLAGGLKALRLYESMNPKQSSHETFVSYVLRPRVRWERLTPYRQLFLEAFSEQEQQDFRRDPQRLAAYVTSNWSIQQNQTPTPGKASPAGTFALKSGDLESIEILLIALCRSFGIPARLHPATQQPQAMVDEEWIALISSSDKAPEFGTLLLLQSKGEKGSSIEPSYRENFTIARLEQGRYTTLQYPFRDKNKIQQPLHLQVGDYRMTTGTRLQNGKVLVRMFYFKIEPNHERILTLTFRELEDSIPVLAQAPNDLRINLQDGSSSDLKNMLGDRGAIVAWIDYRLEPTRHLLREAGELRTELESNDVPLILIVGDSVIDNERISAFIPKPLPDTALFVSDVSGQALHRLSEVCPPPGNEYPHLFVWDREYQVRYAESGYKPGSCSEALAIWRSLQN
ncbi:transglutaminase-like domain-containing protein [Saccharibacillus sp. JS10]|uniref:transglutaminase-like domain-containing protein n=1 Tax=Saccharibacillus sp. JS10 TaxID=2950552 RepID=UPI00210E911E|nr:transglutaminase-like domain-containing protein [Saccharibacillus sp. JS10]MCQ4085279.1 transglutaminase-like domain-containing protein [Saccharibacillus sp. JS10]